MENIKDFILKAAAEEINAAIPVPPPKPKQKVSYETIFASGPDFAVRRRTPKTSMVMVVIVSQGQFYIKDEGAGGTVQNLYEDSLTKFVSGIPDEGYRIQTADGNSPNWITTLCRDAGWRDLFLRAITNEDLYPYMKNDMFNIEVIQNSYYNPHFHEADFSDVKFAFNLVAEHLGREEAKKLILANSGVFFNLFTVYRNYSRQPNTVTPSSFTQIHSRWGIEGVRQFLTIFLETPVTVFPDGSAFKNLFERFDPTVRYYTQYTERQPVAETVFDLQSMVDYMFCECTRQGHADSPTGFWSQWSDYMNQQVLLFGEVREKYSEHLATDEAILTYRCSKLKMQASMEMFQKTAEFLSDFEYSDSAYRILAPKKPDDLIEEGRQLSHCVGSYVDRVASRDTFIFFLRKAAEPERSLVTVQVEPSGRLGQVRGRFNRQPTSEQMRFVEKWHEKFFKNQEGAAA
jgi:hypothetical protein